MTVDFFKNRGLLSRAAVIALVTSLFACCRSPGFAQDGGDSNVEFAEQIRPFFSKHCLRCHNKDKAEGELRIDKLTGGFENRPEADDWVEILDRINLGEMPPQDELQPTAAELLQVTDWIAKRMQSAQRRRDSSGGRVVLRRLTRLEYANTIRDLLGVRFVDGEGPRDLLPPDGSIRGFDRNSMALLVDPSLLNAYLEVAQRVADQAIRFRPPLVPQKSIRFDYKDIVGSAMEYQIEDRGAYLNGDTLVVMQGGARSYAKLRHPFNDKEVPITGRYRVRIQAAAEPGADGKPVFMRIKQGATANLAQFRVDARPEAPHVYEFEAVRDALLQGEYEVSLADGTDFTTYHQGRGKQQRAADELLKSGEIEKATRMKARLRAQGDHVNAVFRPEALSFDGIPKLHLDWIEVTGPLQEAFPPASMQIVFPDGWDSDKLTSAYAKTIFAQLLPRAYRRSVTSAEVEEVVDLVHEELKNGSDYAAAIRIGLVAMLCSPKFLFLYEPVASDDAPRELTSFELATRLSYFLWSSLPDETLLAAAANKKLETSEQLSQQVHRLLSDDRVEGFMTGFVRQWLRIDEFNRFPPDEAIFPEYHVTEMVGIDDDLLEQPLAMVRELVRQDESLDALLDSDWTMLNGRLARLIGVDGIVGEEFRRVPLPESSPATDRGGLLGMPGVHRCPSDGSRTKPVERGKYILDVLFNDPPPPPPPNAGEVEPNVRGEKLTVAERLALHREQPTCRNCHRRIDPYGLALENFNVIGQWRIQVDGEKPIAHWGKDRPAIRVGGTFPSGQTYSSYTEFRHHMAQQKLRFLKGLTEKLLMYALARTVEPGDHQLVEQIVQRTQQEGNTFRALIRNIVLCDAFREK